MNGFLIANKPTGCTSSNVVVFVRKRLPRGTTVGHGGTLDPEASGVLPVCVGSAARLFDYIIDKKKTYVARIKLGEETDTQDATGQVVKTLPVTVGEEEKQVREYKVKHLKVLKRASRKEEEKVDMSELKQLED